VNNKDVQIRVSLLQQFTLLRLPDILDSNTSSGRFRLP
jgi:hypothetical protein